MMHRTAFALVAMCGLSLGTAALAQDRGTGQTGQTGQQQQYGQTEQQQFGQQPGQRYGQIGQQQTGQQPGQRYGQTGQQYRQDQQSGQRNGLRTTDRGYDTWYDQDRQTGQQYGQTRQQMQQDRGDSTLWQDDAQRRQQQPMMMGQYPDQQQQQQQLRQQQLRQQQQFGQQPGQQQHWQTQQQRQQQQFQQNGQAPMVSGRLLDTREVTIQGLDQTHLLARIQTTDGQTVVVDLGDKDRIRDDLTLESGRWLGVSGRTGYINNRQVLVADRIAQVVPIQRDQQQRMGQVNWQTEEQQIFQDDQWEQETGNGNGWFR